MTQRKQFLTIYLITIKIQDYNKPLNPYIEHTIKYYNAVGKNEILINHLGSHFRILSIKRLSLDPT